MTQADAMLDDVGLLRRYATQRDAAAFAELVRRYADFVYGTARRMTGSSAAAEDVSQDCFLRLAQASASITGSVAAWLHRTSVNRSLEIMRSDRARARREVESARQQAAIEPAAQLIAQVDEALAALPAESRIILTEHFLAGRSQTDLAQAAGVNQSTISRRIDRGVEELRERLRAGGFTAAAIGALPTMLETARQTVSPPGLGLALKKIGLSGVQAVPAAAATGAVVSGTILKVAVGTIVTIGAGAFVMHQFGGTGSATPQAAPARAGTTLPTTQKAEEKEKFELDDVVDKLKGEKDDDKDDDKDDEKK